MILEEKNDLKSQNNYNANLFKTGLRKYFHTSRFYWLHKQILKLCPDYHSVLELGCFDAKTLEFLPSFPKSYAGYDANWSNGLDLGRKKWKAYDSVKLFNCQAPKDFNPQYKIYDLSISMETLEHISERDLSAFIAILAKSTKHYCLITIPNEKGPLFLFKYLFKKITRKPTDHYSLKELLYVTIGRTEKVERIQTGHKGFDYRNLIKLLSKHFKIEKISGIPFSFLPLAFNMTIGIIATPKV